MATEMPKNKMVKTKNQSKRKTNKITNKLKAITATITTSKKRANKDQTNQKVENKEFAN